MAVISDGAGTGYKAHVDSNKRLQTKAITVDEASDQAHEGELFSLCTGFLPVTATGGRALHFTYDEADHHFHIDMVTISWNGGNTNKDRTVLFEIYGGDTAPDTNVLTGSDANMLVGSTKTVEGTLLLWNGTGDGMTGHTSGSLVVSGIADRGTTVVHYDGALAIGAGKTLSINLKGEEIGSGSVCVIGFGTSQDNGGGH
jgi:hypothetical protein